MSVSEIIIRTDQWVFTLIFATTRSCHVSLLLLYVYIASCLQTQLWKILSIITSWWEELGVNRLPGCLYVLINCGHYGLAQAAASTRHCLPRTLSQISLTLPHSLTGLRGPQTSTSGRPAASNSHFIRQTYLPIRDRYLVQLTNQMLDEASTLTLIQAGLGSIHNHEWRPETDALDRPHPHSYNS